MTDDYIATVAAADATLSLAVDAARKAYVAALIAACDAAVAACQNQKEPTQ